ncbi:DUF2306 domain-containing protein [Neorhizobium sp. DAR64872/K0K18]|uniref:DUF2306 domain-containing protein n=1 Tax=Neorhizobium sp. DAR64872/K0K18 TaxID=3421958 RepID=UPI003D2C2BE0
MLIRNFGRPILMWVFCPLVALVSFRFLFGGVAETMPDFLYHAELRPLAFYSHIVVASIALLLVPFQLWPGMRSRRIKLHRVLGRVYGFSILVGGISGFWLAVTTTSGIAASWGFGLLAIVWMGATAVGIGSAIRGNIGAHQRWMIRSAALTMAAVTLRIYLVIGMVTGFPYEYIVGLLAWICWVPNLIIAELIIRKPAFATRIPLTANQMRREPHVL